MEFIGFMLILFVACLGPSYLVGTSRTEAARTEAGEMDSATHAVASFVDLVKEMRAAQREFHDTSKRTAGSLSKALKLERAVDRAIAEMEASEGKPGQLRLWGAEGL